MITKNQLKKVKIFFIVFVLTVTVFHGIIWQNPTSTGLTKTSPANNTLQCHSTYCHTRSSIMMNRDELSSPGQQITGGAYDETHPAIAADSSGHMVAGFRATPDGSTFYPTFLYSENNGQTWSEDEFYFTDTATADNPCIDSKPQGIYASIDPSTNESGLTWLITLTDFENPIAESWDWGLYNFNTFKSMSISCYTHTGPNGDPGGWNFGNLVFTGYNDYNGANITGCPFLFYESGSDGFGILGWVANTNGCNHSSNDIDLNTNLSYAVYDRLNTGTGNYQLLLRKDDFGTWTYNGGYYSHPMVFTKNIVSTGNLTYPDVVAQQNDVVIVAQTDMTGNHDVTCYYSSDGFTTYTSSAVANSASEELYPQVQIINDTAFLCTYLKNGSLFYKISTSNGATWGTEHNVSDDQIEPIEWKAANLFSLQNNGYMIWQDGRGENLDIYFSNFISMNHPPNTPNTPVPVNQSTNVPLTTDLSWHGGDPDGDPVTYDVYFGVINPPGKVIANQSTTIYDPGTLNNSTNYYWKIIAWDNHNASSVGPLWGFTTGTDQQPPTTTVTLNGTIGNNGWYISDVTITLTATDDLSGVNKTMYKIDEGNWMMYTAPFTVSIEGTHTLLYYSVDNAGNMEQTKVTYFKIDQIPPHTTHYISGTVGHNGWYIGAPTIILTAIDNTSGVNHIFYKIDSGGWVEYTAPVMFVSEGIHTLEYFSVDTAGNIEQVQGPFTFKFDVTPPSITLTKEKIGLNQEKFTAEVNDGASGIDHVDFSLDDQIQFNDTQSPYEWTWTGFGDHTVTATAYDVAGNSASQSVITPVNQIQSINSVLLQMIQQLKELCLRIQQLT